MKPTPTRGTTPSSDTSESNESTVPVDATKSSESMETTESVGDGLSVQNGRWSFADPTPVRFDAHAARSIPFYMEGHQVILRLSDFFMTDGSRCYDLGCATGKLTAALAQRHQDRREARVTGLDNQSGMIDVARRNGRGIANLDWTTVDVAEAELEPAELVVAYYTLQFIRPSKRAALIDRIYQALRPGGAFILFEKVRAPDARFQDLTSALYTDFKLAQGYSASDILHKARGLKGVLEPFTTHANDTMLRGAGFTDRMTVFKYVCFEGVLAIK